MAFTDAEDLLRRQVEAEFRRRNSVLHEDIEKELSRLCANGLGSSGVAITSFRNLANRDLSERVEFIYENFKAIIQAKRIKYDNTLQQKAVILITELSDRAKDDCLRISCEFIERISHGAIQESKNITDHIYTLKIEEVFNDLEIFTDELKRTTTFSFRTWIRNNATKIIVGIIIATLVKFIEPITRLISEKFYK